MGSSQIKPELSLEAQITKLRPSYFGHFRKRQEPLEKTVATEKMEGSRKRGRLRMKWIDAIEESTALSLQHLSKSVNDKPEATQYTTTQMQYIHLILYLYLTFHPNRDPK